METLKLSKNIKTPDGDGELTELKYDFEDMTAKDKLEASKILTQQGLSFLTVEDIDPNYHVCLFVVAACKANKELEVADVLRMSAKDSKKAGALARGFFYLNSEK